MSTAILLYIIFPLVISLQTNSVHHVISLMCEIDVIAFCVVVLRCCLVCFVPAESTCMFANSEIFSRNYFFFHLFGIYRYVHWVIYWIKFVSSVSLLGYYTDHTMSTTTQPRATQCTLGKEKKRSPFLCRY